MTCSSIFGASTPSPTAVTVPLHEPRIWGLQLGRDSLALGLRWFSQHRGPQHHLPGPGHLQILHLQNIQIPMLVNHCRFHTGKDPEKILQIYYCLS
jgi:hypothetical protein